MHVSVTRVSTSDQPIENATVVALDRMTSVAEVQVEEAVDYEVTFANVGPLTTP